MAGAAYAACRRAAGQLGFNSSFGTIKFDSRRISQFSSSTMKSACLVNTLSLVRRLEAQGVPTKHAEEITNIITEVLNNSLENVAHSLVKGEMQRIEMMQESNLSKFKNEIQKTEMRQESNFSNFKTEIQSSQENFFSLVKHETEKSRTDIENMQSEMKSVQQNVNEKLTSDIEKMRSEVRYEIDKVTAGQRLDLNLEKGRIRDELATQNQETSNLTNKLDREIHALRAHLEAAKYDVIKYCIGTLVSTSAVGLALIRILM